MATLDIAEKENPLTFESSILSLLLNKTTFLWVLCLASVIPFFIGSLHSYNLVGYALVTSIISFLALIHVPITLYLFSDGGIRSQVADRPFVLMGVPCLLIAMSIYMYTQFSADMGSNTPEYLYFFMFAAVSWQHWHFGKQNVGVFAFARLATNSGPLKKFERALIVAGSICGVLVTFALVGPTFKTQFAVTADLSTFETVMPYLVNFGRYLQYPVTVASLVYVAWNWRSMTLPTSILLLIGANFFLPQYLAVDVPATGFIWGYYLAAHGLQYFAFMFFHSLGMADIQARKEPIPEAETMERLKRLGRICAGPATFVLATYFIGDMYTSGRFLTFNGIIDGGLNWLLGMDIKGLTISKIGGGVVVGILLTHFWLDTFFWRLKNKAPREWARSRYNFLF